MTQLIISTLRTPRPLITAILAVSCCLSSCGDKKEAVSTGEKAADRSESSREAKPEVAKAQKVDRSPLPDKVTFNAHIQPVISEKCYHCHGPDSGTRQPKKAPLRLDIEEFAFENRENGKPVIIAGKPAESYLVELINSDDPEIRMPPPEAHHTLTKRDVALIEKWIEQGAEYQQHWSFIKPEKLPVPETSNKTWPNGRLTRLMDLF